jgi:hypothetical protein
MAQAVAKSKCSFLILLGIRFHKYLALTLHDLLDGRVRKIIKNQVDATRPKIGENATLTTTRLHVREANAQNDCQKANLALPGAQMPLGILEKKRRKSSMIVVRGFGGLQSYFRSP